MTTEAYLFWWSFIPKADLSWLFVAERTGSITVETAAKSSATSARQDRPLCPTTRNPREYANHVLLSCSWPEEGTKADAARRSFAQQSKWTIKKHFLWCRVARWNYFHNLYILLYTWQIYALFNILILTLLFIIFVNLIQIAIIQVSAYRSDS